MKPKISIIVPVYNAENYLDDCVRSILNQTYTNIELILVNDGSRDNSHLICEKYACRENVKYILKKNGGASSARNLGIKNASGKFVTFVDADDFISNTMIDELYQNLIVNNAEVACCGFKKYFDENHIYNYAVIDVKGKDPLQTHKMIFEELIGGRGCGSPVCKLYNLDIIIRNNIYFDETISNNEDVLFNLAYFKNIKRAIFLDLYPYYYRKGQDSLSSGYLRSWRSLCVDIFNAKKKILGDDLCVDQERLLQHSWFLLNLIGIINELFCKDCEISKGSRLENINWYFNNISRIRDLKNVVYRAYDYPDRRYNFRRIYPLFVYIPIPVVKLFCRLLIKFK